MGRGFIWTSGHGYQGVNSSYLFELEVERAKARARNPFLLSSHGWNFSTASSLGFALWQVTRFCAESGSAFERDKCVLIDWHGLGIAPPCIGWAQGHGDYGKVVSASPSSPPATFVPGIKAFASAQLLHWYRLCGAHGGQCGGPVLLLLPFRMASPHPISRISAAVQSKVQSGRVTRCCVSRNELSAREEGRRGNFMS